MKSVGIIANPASGKDIRRLVAYGSVFDNHEKVNIVRRVLLGLDAMAVQQAVFMPDPFGIGKRALEDLELSMKTGFLDIPIDNSQDDSIRAAEALNAMEVTCIITLGGDGTNRAVVKACGDTPILPISTGTNNVFPFMLESTMAGMAAGVIAADKVSLDQLTCRVPKLEILKKDKPIDIALVDAVVSKAGFIGSRAVWDVSTLLEVFLARAQPGNIGFSSIGGHLCALDESNGKGVHIVIGENKKIVRAPIAPGLIREVPVKSYRIFNPWDALPISHSPCMIALDGEREILVKPGEQLHVRFSPQGPLVVDVSRTLKEASKLALFTNPD